MDMVKIDHGPAVIERCYGHKNPSFDYPERFNDRVPKTIEIVRGARSDHFATLSIGRDLIASKGETYPAWTNRHGAVSAILPCGEKLGLYPNEFKVSEWLDLDAKGSDQ